jgi:hypothetical protein
MTDAHPTSPESGKPPDETGHEMEEYGGGSIEGRHGYIPAWLLFVYFVLFVWALYYAYQYWGGVGPGRI